MDVVQICNALGNKTRYELIKALRCRDIGTFCNRIEYYENGVSVGDVVKLTGLAQSTVSQHLSVLLRAGLVIKQKREPWSCYFLNTKLVDEFLETLKSDMKSKD